MTKLRPYQRRDADAILAGLQRGDRGILYSLPTGGGKTVVATEVINTVAHQARWETWMLVHRRELLLQASVALSRLGIRHGRIAPGEPMTTDLVQVASIDTVRARLDQLGPRLERVRLVVPDEAHHCVADSWAAVLRAMRNAQRFGMTATAYRHDGRGLGEVFTTSVHGPTIADLIDDGWLTRPAVYAPGTALDLSGVRKVGGDYVVSDLARVVDTPEMARAAVRWYARLMPGVPVVIFCVTVEHARNVAKVFSKAGWHAASVDGSLSTEERDTAIAALGNGRLQALTSCMLISEGTDIPIVGGCISLRPTRSTGLQTQQVGRVLRPIYGGGFSTDTVLGRLDGIAASDKPEAVILDMVGNVAAHGMPDAVRPWTLQDGVRGLERSVPGTARCGTCARVVQVGPMTCPSCGSRLPAGRPTMFQKGPGPSLFGDHAPVVGSLTALDVASMRLADLMERVTSRAELQRIAAIKGYRKGWVDHAHDSLLQRGRRIA